MRTIIPAARGLIAALFIVALTACGGGSIGVVFGDPEFGQPAPPQVSDTFAATLSAPEVSSDASTAQGAGTVVINPASRHMTAVVVANSGIDAASVLIRQSVPGALPANDPIMVALIEAPAGSGVWVATAALSEAQVSALRAGEWYFELRSILVPPSVLRGQLLPQLPGALAGTPLETSGGAFGSTGAPATGFSVGTDVRASFFAALRGANNVPPTSSAAEGSGAATVNPSTRQIAAAIIVTGMTPTSAAIRTGAPGFNGPLTVTLSEALAGSGVWLARTVLSEVQFNALRAGNLYFSVQSVAFPEGEIRGQLLPQQVATGLVSAPDFGVSAAGGGFDMAAPGDEAGFGGFDSGLPGVATVGSNGFGMTGTAAIDFGDGPGLSGTFPAPVFTPGA